jgi:serine/threonine protein kinase
MVDISASTIYELGFPTLALQLYSTYNEVSPISDSWDTSILNPKNRMDCGTPTCISSLDWRIDGSSEGGTRFFALSSRRASQLPVLRIDVHVPDQSHHPPELRNALQSNLSAVLKDSRVGSLGISHIICHSLHHRSRKDSNFCARLRTLPFGSKIVIPKITGSKYCPVHIVPAHDLEKELLSVNRLRTLWENDLKDQHWPPVINLGELQICSQIHDSISLVHIPSLHSDQVFVFKSPDTEPKFLYHELKVLLTLSSHPNILSKPLYIVIKRCAFGGKKAVCGFVLPYYLAGSLRDALPSRSLSRELTLKTQMKWSYQITEALHHIYYQGGFYSDLRPDNILLSSPASDKDGTSGGDNIILVDFEQRGNWFVWSAPEVRYYEYLENIISSLPLDEITKFALLFRTHFSSSTDAATEPEHASKLYESPNNGYYAAWVRLSHEQRESATTYSLGKLLWCIFEGQSNVERSFRNSLRHEPDLEFPSFRHTPLEVRELIRHCTRDGSPQRYSRRCERMPIVRVAGKLFPKGATGTNGEREATADETRAIARSWWRVELEIMEEWFREQESREKRDKESGGDSLLDNRRPRLRDVLMTLRHIKSELNL